MDSENKMLDVKLYCGDCLDILPTIPDQSVDAVITDPPYPHIKRDYGYWTVEEWWALIVEGVVPQVRRILKPTGSAVFILQPNSEKVGKMRGWLWEFMAWVCREWNMVQDVWWWNVTAIPMAGAPSHGLMRQSIKSCVWCGSPRCHRNQKAVLWTASADTVRLSHQKRFEKRKLGDSRTVNDQTCTNAYLKHGGVTPYNLLPISNASHSGAGAYGHGAGTPLKLADWWTRYICPPGGTVCDPFMGSGTMGLAAVQNGCGFIGIEKMSGRGYFETAEQRIEKARQEMAQLKLSGLHHA